MLLFDDYDVDIDVVNAIMLLSNSNVNCCSISYLTFVFMID